MVQVGGMGDVVTALGRAVQEEGHKVEVILPKYDCIQYDEVSLSCGNMAFDAGLFSLNFKWFCDILPDATQVAVCLGNSDCCRMIDWLLSWLAQYGCSQTESMHDSHRSETL